MARTRQLHWAGLAAVAVLVTACGGGAPPAPTVKVDRGPVSTSVSASGSLVSTNEANLGFADRGKIAEIMVKVGDKVTAGQALARLDDAALTQAYNSAKAKLDQQNAALGKITGSYTVEGAQAALDAANSVLEATKRNVNAVNEANSAATRRAQIQLDFDREVLRSTPCDPPKTDSAAAPQTKPTKQPKPSNNDSDDASSNGLIGMGEPSTAQVRPVAFSTPLTGDDDDGFETCAGKQSAQRQVILSEAALSAAKHTEDTAATQGRISITNAEAQVVTAENTLENNSRDNSADANVQEAVKRDAQIAVDGALRDLNNATLKAPADGTVSSINGLVGEFIQGSTGGTPQAPGAAIKVPNATGGTSGTTGSTAGGTAAGSFITITNIDSFQLVVPFEESDAAQVAANQEVEVTVDAIPGLTKKATVVSVAPTSDSISGVINYYATIVLNETDPRLKDGQTAKADVITKTVPNALRVPANAVRADPSGSAVNIPGPDGKPVPAPVTTGLQGDDFTEITSGLQEGQDVLLPQATVNATGGSAENRGGGGGG